MNVRVKHAGEETPAVGRPRLLDKSSMPKALFFLAAGLSFLMSVYLFFTGDPDRGIFVGIWVPSILSAGSLLLQGERGNE